MSTLQRADLRSLRGLERGELERLAGAQDADLVGVAAGEGDVGEPVAGEVQPVVFGDDARCAVAAGRGGAGGFDVLETARAGFCVEQLALFDLELFFQVAVFGLGEDFGVLGGV